MVSNGPDSEPAFDASIIPSSVDLMQKEQGRIDKEKEFPTTLVSNGCVDFRGRIADKRYTGGWSASPFIIVNEFAERLAFFAIAVNMVAYLVSEMGLSIPTAATYVTDWIGAAYVLTLFGAFMADAYLGRFKTIIIFSCIYAVGMVLLTVSAAVDSLRPPKCMGSPTPCVEASSGQIAFLYSALYLIALGTGGIKPCVSSFGADQFDEEDEREFPKKYGFFSWFYFSINMGALIGITLLVYVQEKKGWVWGFGVPTVSTIVSIIIVAAGIRFYRFQKPMGSPFTRFLQVIVASLRNHFRGVRVTSQSDLYEVNTEESDIMGVRKLPHTSKCSFLDKAAVVTDAEANTKNRWRLCTVTQVEEFKCFIRVLPVWATTIALSISFAQMSTFFLSQARITDRKLGPHFKIPLGSIPVFSAINALVLVPIYEGLIVPILRKWTGHHRGITSLQRMGVGLFISIFAMASAALVEKKRRFSPNPTDMRVFWLFPQFFLLGSAEVLTYVGQLEFFYNEATDGTRSICSAMFLSEIGIGSWLSTALVTIVERTTGGQEKGWLRKTLINSRVDYFYWLLTIINGVNFFVYLWFARRYQGRSGNVGRVRGESQETRY